MAVFQRTLAIFATLLLAACATAPSGPSPEARQALAPTGKLRVGLFLGSATSAVKDPTTGETKGIAHEMGKALAEALGVPFEPVTYTALPALFEGGRKGEWDVGFFGASPERSQSFDFSRPFLHVHFGYLVASTSSLSNG